MRNGRIARHDNGSRVTDDELFADDPELEQETDDYERSRAASQRLNNTE
jgi:hypothetical protein